MTSIMDFEQPLPSLYRFQPHANTDRYQDHPINYYYSIPNHIPVDLSNPNLPTMERFLLEPDYPFPDPLYYETDHATTKPIPDLPYDVGARLPSPTASGLESSNVSSGWSDRQASPHSPHQTGSPYTPEYIYDNGIPYAYGGHAPVDRQSSRSGEGCVAMQDIQKCADEAPDNPMDDDTVHLPFNPYGPLTQEGYQPMQDGDDCVSDASCSPPESEYLPMQTTQRCETESPVIRRRRAQSRSTSSSIPTGRVSKRPSAGRQTSSNQSPTHGEASGAFLASGSRAFPCPLAIYGCHSSFGSKNEWKRHVNTQHMRLGYWRCDKCTNQNGERRPNDFNRKDLFIQHVRRMHPNDPPQISSSKRSSSRPSKGNMEEQALQEAATRCYRPLRSAPEQSACLFCEQKFHGRNTWDERMEHVGRHMEQAKKENEEPIDPRNWRVDESAQMWLINEQIVVPSGKQLTLATS